MVRTSMWGHYGALLRVGPPGLGRSRWGPPLYKIAHQIILTTSSRPDKYNDFTVQQSSVQSSNGLIHLGDWRPTVESGVIQGVPMFYDLVWTMVGPTGSG